MKEVIKMVNLLEETIEVLKSKGKDEKDVMWVGSRDGKYAISWEEFKKIADIEYDCKFGAQEIAEDLVVVGKDWWLERHEYDGSEWWEFKTLPRKQRNPKKFTKVKARIGWESLDEINS